MATKVSRLIGIVCGILLLSLLAGCGGGGGGGGGGGVVTLTAIELTPASVSLAAGTTRQLVATGIFSDASKQDLTDSVTWTSLNTSVATVGGSTGVHGLVAGLTAGSADITATSGSITGNTLLTVTSATLVSIGVTPTAPTVDRGTSRQFTATGVFSDNSVQDLTTAVTWISSDLAVAIISNFASSNGLATPVGFGSTTITATLGGISGSTPLTVTAATLIAVEVTPTAASLAVGTSRTFAATGIFSDNTRQDLTADVTWSSSAPTVASVSNAEGSRGLAAGLTVGVTTIRATIGSLSGASSLTVTAAPLVAIEITPLSPQIARGTDQQFTAVGAFSNNTTQDLTSDVTWSSTNTSVASISNAQGSNGLAAALATGATTIAATLSGISGSTALTVTAATLVAIDVTPAIPSIAAGLQQQFTATGRFTDGTVKDLTTEVAWNSSLPAVAAISNVEGSAGLASSLAPGETTINAALGAVSGDTLLTVSAAALEAIEVTPPDPTVPLSLSRQFTATGIYTDNSFFDLTEEVTWSASPQGVASVSNGSGATGLATPIAPGMTTVTATLSGISGSTTLTVSPATLVSIAITPATAGIAMETVQAFTATGTFSDNSAMDLTNFVTWFSSAPAVAVISNAEDQKGVAAGIAPGATSITAALGSIVSSAATLTVTSATLQSIAITPANATIARGTSAQFTATGTYSDNFQQDLTALAVWSSSNSSVVKISIASSSRGLATGLGTGTNITISATFGGRTGSTPLSVVTATLDGLVISPETATVARGTTLQFTAFGLYNGGLFQQDLTKEVKWASSNKGVASISNGRGTRGLATATGVGTTSISATKPATVITGATTLTVTP